MSSNAKPLLVILPGAFHTPESYRRITEPLLSKGYEVLAIDYLVTARSSEPDPNPALSFTDDATALREKLIPLFNEGGEAVLISHSYGSLPATHTAVGQTTLERNERGERGGVAAVINIAGFAFPARGRNIMGEESETPAMPYQVVEVCSLYKEILDSGKHLRLCSDEGRNLQLTNPTLERHNAPPTDRKTPLLQRSPARRCGCRMGASGP
jgi:pimeloyl-ACP methyl ester carboxylesterase